MRKADVDAPSTGSNARRSSVWITAVRAVAVVGGPRCFGGGFDIEDRRRRLTRGRRDAEGMAAYHGVIPA